MTNFQRAVSVLLSLCFFAVLALAPGPFFLWGNVYSQLPLYRFLEKESRSVKLREDPETLARITADNAAFLGRQVQEENQGTEKRRQNADKPAEAAPEQGETDLVLRPAPTQAGEEAVQRPMPAQAGSSEDLEDTSSALADEEPESGTGVQVPESGTPAQADDSAGQPDVQEEQGGAGSLAQAGNPLLALTPGPVPSPESLADYNYLMNEFFILDTNAATSAQQISAQQFLEKDLRLEKDASVPQILIYHSHSQEAFADSREGVQEDTVVGVGDYLESLLTEMYGYNVIHVRESFDLIDGQVDRSRAYDYAREYLEQVLAENPSVEVLIDLHRDGVPDDRRLVTEINGKDTAQVMLYNGLSCTAENGPVDYLPNPYIQDNLAFSFQLEYQAARYYPDLYRGIYLAGLRYNLHLRPRALLLEAGAQTNTLQEVKNAMEPFAALLDLVLSSSPQQRG